MITIHLSGVERSNFIAYGHTPSRAQGMILVNVIDEGGSLMLVYRNRK